jgi:hypothetical protein
MLVFLHGTARMHAGAVGEPRAARRHEFPCGRILFRDVGQSDGELVARAATARRADRGRLRGHRPRRDGPSRSSRRTSGARVKWIVVREFAGFGGLPASLEELLEDRFDPCPNRRSCRRQA